MSQLAAERRARVSSKRQMMLDWKRVATEVYRLNKIAIEKEVDEVVTKLQTIAYALTRET